MMGGRPGFGAPAWFRSTEGGGNDCCRGSDSAADMVGERFAPGVAEPTAVILEERCRTAVAACCLIMPGSEGGRVGGRRLFDDGGPRRGSSGAAAQRMRTMRTMAEASKQIDRDVQARTYGTGGRAAGLRRRQPGWNGDDCCGAGVKAKRVASLDVVDVQGRGGRRTFGGSRRRIASFVRLVCWRHRGRLSSAVALRMACTDASGGDRSLAGGSGLATQLERACGR